MRSLLLCLLAVAPCAAASSSSSPPLEATYFVKHQAHLQSALLEAFEGVSDPAHASWGLHLSHDDVARLQAPARAHADAVLKHVATLGASSVATSVAGDKVVVQFARGLPSQASLLPASLEHAVDFVASTRPRPARLGEATALPKKTRRTAPTDGARYANAAVAGDPQSCLFDKAVPPCIRVAYGLNDTYASDTTKATQCVVVNQGYKPSDVKTFQSKYGLPNQPVAANVGSKPLNEAGDEATLDVEYIMSMGVKIPTTWVYINGHTANPFASWLTWASNTTTIPLVHSLSVGEPEGGFASDNGGLQAITRMNAELMALGARGVSILFASGDSGYQVQQKYPASSPYVTSVGGATLGSIFRQPAISVDSISTGGFSSLSANLAQKWQTKAVAHYMTTKGERPGGLNVSRRCVPDISAYSTGFYTIQDGSDQVIGGTSASTPVAAGMFSLINDALLAKGLSPLGFLNPFLYANEDAFLDVTHGDNVGFAAVAGYDPASGLGTFSPTTFSTLRARALKAAVKAVQARR